MGNWRGKVSCSGDHSGLAVHESTLNDAIAGDQSFLGAAQRTPAVEEPTLVHETTCAD